MLLFSSKKLVTFFPPSAEIHQRKRNNERRYTMEEAVQMAVVFGSILLAVKFLTEFFLRRRLIDKGLVDEKVKYLFADVGMTHLLSNIKWGMLLIAIGLALFWKQFSPYRVEDETIFGLMFLFGGIGFLVYYFVAKSYIEKRRREGGQG